MGDFFFYMTNTGFAISSLPKNNQTKNWVETRKNHQGTIPTYLAIDLQLRSPLIRLDFFISRSFVQFGGAQLIRIEKKSQTRVFF